MEALNNKEKAGVALFIGGVVTMLVGGVGILFSKQLELTEHQKSNMRRTVQVGAVASVGGFICLSVLAGKRQA